MQRAHKIESDFANPPNWYRPAPFWFWNHDLSEEEIRRQVRLMQEGGIGGFFMHARYGRITPYLSEAWHRMIGAAVDEARDQQMYAWLYDEDNWPSGSAGGQTVRENYRFAASHVKLFVEELVDGPTTLDIELPQDGEFVEAYAIPIEDGAPCPVPDGVLLLTDTVADGRLCGELPDGKWLVVGLQRHFTRVGFNAIPVDTFKQAAIARFIELTHQAYKDRFGDAFGELVPGIFFDEISMNYGRTLLPWTDGLLEQFEERMGYDFRRCVPALLYDVGEKTAKYRADFYGFLTWLYSESTLKQIYDFCDSCGLRSTGHFNNEHALSTLSREQGNFFTLARHMHVPGIDHLGDCTWPIAFSAKLASSASHLLGKERTLCESFGLAKSWALTLGDIKRLGDFEFACGINLIVPHAFYYSIQGHRKWECIPNHFYQTSFWPYYREFSDYSARVALVLSSGRHVADIAVYCPFESMHVNDFAGLSEHKDLSRFEYYEARARRTENDVHELVQALMSSHHDFDFLDSELLISASVEDGKLVVKGEGGEPLESFKCLILPSATTVPAKVIRKLKEFVKAGGIVLAAGLLPTESTEKGRDASISDAARKLFGIDPAEVEAAVLAGNDPGASEKYLGSPASWIDGPAWALLGSRLEGLIGRDVSIAAGGEEARDVIYHHVSLPDEGEVYFFANVSKRHNYDAVVSLRAPGVPVELDPQTGGFGLGLGYKEKDGRLEIPLAFTTGQSHIVLMRPPGSPGELIYPIFRRSGRHGQPAEIIELPNTWRFRTEHLNALPITDWKLEMWTGKNMFNFHSIYRGYSATFRVRDYPKSARILLDGLMPFDRQHSRVLVWVNDHQITALDEGQYLDRLIGEADVTKLLRRGENEIRIETTSIFEEAEYLGNIVYLVGDFALEREEDAGWVIVSPRKDLTGSWHEKGYPFYSGIGVYEQEFKVPASWAAYRRIILTLDKVSDLADVSINERRAGVVAWNPLEVDVMPVLRPGRNTLAIRVANTMSNLIALEPIESGLTGRVLITAHVTK